MHAFFTYLLLTFLLMNTAEAKNVTTGDLKGSLDSASLYITLNGDVTDPIVSLLGLTGIRILNDTKIDPMWPEAKLYLNSRALAEVVSAVQGKLDPALSWFGDPSRERWEEDSQKNKLSLSHATRIVSLCMNDLHQGEATYPHDTPKAVLFLGATLSRVRQRLAYLNALYDLKKLAPSLPLYILTGERKLDETIGETLDDLMNPHNGIISFRQDWSPSKDLILDEGKMIELVLSQSRHPKLAAHNIHSVYSPKGEQRRATTESTVKQWLADFSPVSGLYIAISNQPYNFYQEVVIRRVLLQAGRSDIAVKVIGPGMNLTIENTDQLVKEAQNLLNNNSRILYELLKIREF